MLVPWCESLTHYWMYPFLLLTKHKCTGWLWGTHELSSPILALPWTSPHSNLATLSKHFFEVLKTASPWFSFYSIRIPFHMLLPPTQPRILSILIYVDPIPRFPSTSWDRWCSHRYFALCQYRVCICFFFFTILFFTWKGMPLGKARNPNSLL